MRVIASADLMVADGVEVSTSSGRDVPRCEDI
jgi:hypothetical protein